MPGSDIPKIKARQDLFIEMVSGSLSVKECEALVAGIGGMGDVGAYATWEGVIRLNRSLRRAKRLAEAFLAFRLAIAEITGSKGDDFADDTTDPD